MTIEISLDEFFEQSQEANEEQLPWDLSDDLDITYKFDAHISQGWWRDIKLREGLWLTMDRHQLTDRLVMISPEQEVNDIYCVFMLSGKGHASRPTKSGVLQTNGKYYLTGTGIDPKTVGDYSDVEPISFVEVSIQSAILLSFSASLAGELPENLQHLIKSPDEVNYIRYGDTQPRMTTALKEIMQCPYQGLVKRAYLESKVIELIALVLDHEVTIQQGEPKKNLLKPEQLERIHYAREILLRDMYNPPSLEDLARQVGLNDFLLKKGFRQVFGNTVFGELQMHRLELAKRLLAEGKLSAAEVSRLAGYASPNSFAKAFKKKFGFTPTTYRKSCRMT